MKNVSNQTSLTFYGVYGLSRKSDLRIDGKSCSDIFYINMHKCSTEFHTLIQNQGCKNKRMQICLHSDCIVRLAFLGLAAKHSNTSTCNSKMESSSLKGKITYRLSVMMRYPLCQWVTFIQWSSEMSSVSQRHIWYYMLLQLLDERKDTGS